ncbi:MAG: AAA family ATPase [Oscillospiraceae bacterium]|nr:AAA family ATPase [Oscillospiraceae bacterium]
MNFYRIKAVLEDEQELSLLETPEFTAFTTGIPRLGDNELAVAVRPEFSNNGFVEKICAEMGLKPLSDEAEEVTVHEFERMLLRADGRVLSDSSRLERALGLRDLGRFNEFVADRLSREEISQRAFELMYGKTLLPELERIYARPNTTGRIFHPAHYILRCREDEKRELISGLISALYENRRLVSMRCCELNNTRDFKQKLFDMMRGAAVIINVDYGDNDGESAFRRSRGMDGEDIKQLIPIINCNLRNVLIIIAVSGGSENNIEELKTRLDAPFVTIEYENADYEGARSYLSALAEKSGLKRDNELFAELKEGRKYGKSEILSMYNQWYNQKLRTDIFPQYAQVRKAAAPKESVKSDAAQSLRSMVGLNRAKEVIFRAVNFYRMNSTFKSLGKTVGRPAMHMVFTGNPGTAKTTVARLFAQILKDNDIITEGRLVEVGRADLVGKYVGHTAPLVRNAFDKADGGVLFIDEAYSLLDDKGGMFGDEAINTIVQEMENRRDKLIVIFAGYKNEMERFLDRNPGLRSRVAFTVPFEDYGPGELMDIARLMAKSGGNELEPSAEIRLNEIFARAAKEKNFGNGRFVRSLMEKAEINRASRLTEADSLTLEMLGTFTADDFDFAPALPQKRPLGFNA